MLGLVLFDLVHLLRNKRPWLALSAFQIFGGTRKDLSCINFGILFCTQIDSFGVLCRCFVCRLNPIVGRTFKGSDHCP
jgi:hypothetical protein